MESSNQFLGTERIGKLMQKYAIPCIISLLVGALYNIVDQIFIANASYLGSYGNAANTVVFPLTVVALAIAVMIGDGCCAFVSISLGQNEVPKAKRSVGNAVVMCLVSSILLAALYLIFADTILAMFGGTVNAETYHHSQEYFFYITLGVPFYMFGQAMNPIIRADGNPKFAMISTLAGAVINIILDPLMIFGIGPFPELGIRGAALATVLSQICSTAYILRFLLGGKAAAQTGGQIQRLLRSLDDQRAGAAERILHERVTAHPAQIGDGGGQRLLDGCQRGVFAVAALVQTVTGGVEIDFHRVLAQRKADLVQLSLIHISEPTRP